ncbi:MAG: PDZ domain-containing protein, partial [Planctomycetota bacterium]
MKGMNPILFPLIFVLFGVLGCSPQLHDNDPPIPSPVLRTPSGKIIESVLGNLILHDPPQTSFKFRVKEITSSDFDKKNFSQGLEVTWVSKEAKDLMVGDIIVGAIPLSGGSEIEIRKKNDLQLALQEYLSEDGLQLLVIKKNNFESLAQKKAVVLTTENPTQNTEILALDQAWDTTYLGAGFVSLEKLSKKDRPKHILDDPVVFLWLSSNTIAARKGLFPLDAILSIDGVPIKNCFQAVDLIQKHNGEGVLQIQVRHPDFTVETIDIDLIAEHNELVVHKIPAIYGVKYSQRGEASSFLGVYNGTWYSYKQPEHEMRSSEWDISELTQQNSDILYSPKPEFHEEQYFRF